MALSHFNIELDPPNAPVVRIDALALPTGVVQAVQIEQTSPNDIPQLILFMSAGHISVNGTAVVSTEGAGTGTVRDFLSQVDPHALSEAACALQGRSDPRNPGRYIDNPTEALLVALSMLCEDG